jgi:urease accessory protein
VVEQRRGQSTVTRCRGSVPVAPRLLARAPPGFAGIGLVQTAGGPLGGDAVTIDVDVGPGAALALRTIAATVVLPGAGPATQAIRITLAPRARLLYHAEPVIVSASADYRSALRIDLGAGAAALVRETVVRGRYGERGGAIDMRLRCDHDGRPLLRDAVRIDGATDPAADTAAVLNGARAYGSLALLGSGAAPTDPDACPLAGPGIVLRAVASDAATLEARLDAVMATWQSALTSIRSSITTPALATRSMSAGSVSP